MNLRLIIVSVLFSHQDIAISQAGNFSISQEFTCKSKAALSQAIFFLYLLETKNPVLYI